ncbi:MAG: carbohydrate kinase family protein [Deltaproteobacteria bacterium]|nr:carbohydrate kinase family protein [Deltaproteobacteria bacterium]
MNAGKLACLAVGHVTHDRVADEILPGGCAYYAARVWAGLGGSACLASVVGEDFRCDAALEGLALLLRRAGSTTVFANFYPPGAARVQFVESIAPHVEPAGLPERWLRPDVLFLGPVMGEIDIAAWKQACRPRLVAIGVQGFVRQAAPLAPEITDSLKVIPRLWQPSSELLAGVDVACLSEEDLAGQEGLLDRLTASVPLVALTRERRGCDLIEKRARCWVGIHPSRVVDPTGAGDSFAAGLLFGLARGLPVRDAGRLGAAAASIVIEGRASASIPQVREAFARAELVP